MGCDIHVYVEKFDEESKQWFLTKAEIHGAENRNYNLFGALAGVRQWDDEDSTTPKGIPDDASLGFKDACTMYGVDGHSHNWHEFDDFIELLKEHSYDFNDVVIADLKMRKSNLNNEEKGVLDKYESFVYYVADWACEWNEPASSYAKHPAIKLRVCYFFDN